MRERIKNTRQTASERASQAFETASERASQVLKLGKSVVEDYFEDRQQRKEDAENDYEQQKQYPRDLDPLRTDAVEILGENPRMLRGRFRKQADKLEEKADKLENNPKEPGIRERILKWRANRTKIKIDRLRGKLKEGGWKSNDRVRAAKLKDLELKQNRLKKDISERASRRREMPEKLRKKIDEYVQKKVKAMDRKARRKILREEGIEWYDFEEKAEFLANLSDAEKKRIAREAILLVRKKNIEKGLLEPAHSVDQAAPQDKVRKVGDHYERVAQ